METKEILSRGTKPESPVREIKPRPPWETDLQVLKYDIQWYKDEIINLERDKRELEEKLFDKDVEIEELIDEVERLHNKIISVG